MKIWDDFLEEAKENLSSGIECEIKMMHSKSALTRFEIGRAHV